jgi:hypothetical protein
MSDKKVIVYGASGYRLGLVRSVCRASAGETAVASDVTAAP